MKFVISKNLMEETLARVSKGVSAKTPMPVLTGIKIVVKGKKITFVSTNREISVRVEHQASDDLKLVEDGEIVAPGKYLIDIVKKVDNGDKIDISLLESATKSKMIKIITKNLDVSLAPLDGENFPVINFDLKTDSFKMPVKDFKQIVRQTSFACATNEANVLLTSVNFVVKENELLVTATDSFRLARKVAVLTDNALNVQMNVPYKSLEEFAKICVDTDEMLQIYPTSSVVLFKIGNLSFVSRLVEGNYHDTSSLFKLESVLAVKFNRVELMSAVDKASLFVNASINGLNFVKIEISAQTGIVKVASNSTGIGQVTVSINPLEVSEKKDFNVAFSANNLMEALKAFEDNEVTVNFTGEIKPARITTDKDASITQILIPVRTF